MTPTSSDQEEKPESAMKPEPMKLTAEQLRRFLFSGLSRQEYKRPSPVNQQILVCEALGINLESGPLDYRSIFCESSGSICMRSMVRSLVRYYEFFEGPLININVYLSELPGHYCEDEVVSWLTHLTNRGIQYHIFIIFTTTGDIGHTKLGHANRTALRTYNELSIQFKSFESYNWQYLVKEYFQFSPIVMSTKPVSQLPGYRQLLEEISRLGVLELPTVKLEIWIRDRQKTDEKGMIDFKKVINTAN